VAEIGGYRCFGTPNGPIFKREDRTLKMEETGCHETVVTNYQSMWCNIQEE